MGTLLITMQGVKFFFYKITVSFVDHVFNQNLFLSSINIISFGDISDIGVVFRIFLIFLVTNLYV